MATETRTERLLFVPFVMVFVVGVIVVSTFLVDSLSLPIVICAVLGVGGVFAFHIWWTTRPHRVVHVCAACTRRSGPGMYCAFCGAQHAVLAAHLLEDVSVEVSGGKTALLVPYGTRLPVTVSDKFSTVDDGQPSVELHLVTGIATPLRKTIARINSKLLLDQPRRVPTVAMTLTIDERGELEVELREVGSESVVRRHGFSVPVSTPGRKPDQVN